jgi:hypothetical protein
MHYSECLHAECRDFYYYDAEYHYAEYRYAECHYSECHFAECLGAKLSCFDCQQQKHTGRTGYHKAMGSSHDLYFTT